MNKVDFPAIHCADVFETCLSSISESNYLYKNKMRMVSRTIKEEWEKFDGLCHDKNLHLFKPCQPRNALQNIVGDVTKQDLMLLYSRYMLKEKKESRKIYDKIRAASNGICPLCGIHGVSTLDHYLPKARYPMLSIYPKNLIPACRDCNSGKADSIFETASDQTLYPYNDDSKFYNTDWISASISSAYGILIFSFYPDPPARWLEVERNRVVSHFNSFDLRSKYQINAAQFVSTITSDIRRLLECGDYITVKDHYDSLSNKVPKNSTLRVMYNAITRNEDICSGKF